MISIIICHHNPSVLDQLEKNIKNTIGVPYEMVVIDNTANKYNIFQAYNQGVKQSKFDVICFAHEDILFHTQDWGKKVIEHFKDPNLGVIGVAGSHYFPKLPSALWSTSIRSQNIIHTIAGKRYFEAWRYIGKNESSAQAVIVDGVWFCISKAIMKQIRFDDVTFSGFHCYDSDICLQVFKLNYDIKIVFNITIEHFSCGTSDANWLKNIFLLYKKWKIELPLSSVNLSKAQMNKANFSAAKEIFRQVKRNKMGAFYYIKAYWYYLRYIKLIIVLRQNISQTYPEISYYNSLINSFKYILKNKLHHLWLRFKKNI